ncbi:hypothetical protein NPIL_405181, partial [Nephila pilipes]
IGVSSVPSLCAHLQALNITLTINNHYGKFIECAAAVTRVSKNNTCTVTGPNVTMGFDLEESITPEDDNKGRPRKYYPRHHRQLSLR